MSTRQYINVKYVMVLTVSPDIEENWVWIGPVWRAVAGITDIVVVAASTVCLSRRYGKSINRDTLSMLRQVRYILFSMSPR